MKSFDEWFEENYLLLSYEDEETDNVIKRIAMESWQASQEVQRESDAMISYMYDNEFIGDKIRNNKAV